MRNYWLGAKNYDKKICWTKWSIICTKKEKCGMGFKDMSIFNDVLLSKQSWRNLTNQNKDHEPDEK